MYPLPLPAQQAQEPRVCKQHYQLPPRIGRHVVLVVYNVEHGTPGGSTNATTASLSSRTVSRSACGGPSSLVARAVLVVEVMEAAR